MRVDLEAVLFDLDGTLIDSVRDIAAALNMGLGSVGRESLPLERVRGFIGDGMPLLLERALEASGGPAGASEFTHALATVRRHYEENPVRFTRPYDGIEDLLRDLSPIPLAVVSNKPEGLCRLVLANLGLASRFVTVLGGDSLAARKPNPEPIRVALDRLSVSNPSRAVFVGDGPQDVAAGRAAGVRTIGVTWGLGALPIAGPDCPDDLVASVAELRARLIG